MKTDTEIIRETLIAEGVTNALEVIHKAIDAVRVDTKEDE